MVGSCTAGPQLCWKQYRWNSAKQGTPLPLRKTVQWSSKAVASPMTPPDPLVEFQFMQFGGKDVSSLPEIEVCVHTAALFGRMNVLSSVTLMANSRVPSVSVLQSLAMGESSTRL